MEKQINPMALSYKNPRVITMYPVHNGGHLMVCSIKISSRHMEEVSGISDQTAQLPKLQEKGCKVPHVE